MTTTTTRRTTRSTAAAAVLTKEVTTPTKATTPTKSSALTTKLGELRAKGEALARERGGGGDSETMTTTGNETNEEEGGNFTSPVKYDEGQNDPKDDEDEISVTSPTTTTNVVASTLTPTMISLTSARPGYRAELARLQTKISTLETDLRKKNAECASLQSSLNFMSKGAEQSMHDAVRMYSMGALAMSGGVKGTSPVKARRSLVGEMMLEGKVSRD